jgi:DNA-binding NarL/FixJ family response regulator
MAVEGSSKVAIVSAYRYRAESLAFTLAQRLNQEMVPFTDFTDQLDQDFAVILIDLDVGMDAALRLTRAVTSKRSQARVVLVGLIESEENVLRLAEAGVSGYVLAAASFADLLSVIQSVQKGEFGCRPEITYALFSHLARLASDDRQNPPDTSLLTMRERQIFQLMSQRLMNKEIAARLYLSEHTVKNHVHHILKKLGMRNRSFAARPQADLHLAATARSCSVQ